MIRLPWRACRDNGMVATWHEFESGAPEMAAAAAMLWPGITALGRGQPAPPGTPCFPIAFLVRQTWRARC